MNDKQKSSKVKRIFTVVVIGFVVCAIMKTFVCGKLGKECPCEKSEKGCGNASEETAQEA